jgi:hypothetical protein
LLLGEEASTLSWHAPLMTVVEIVEEDHAAATSIDEGKIKSKIVSRNVIL